MNLFVNFVKLKIFVYFLELNLYSWARKISIFAQESVLYKLAEPFFNVKYFSRIKKKSKDGKQFKTSNFPQSAK